MGSQSRSCRARECFRAFEAPPDPQHRAEAEADGLRWRLRCGPTGNNSRSLALIVAHPRGRAREPPAPRLPTLVVFPPRARRGEYRPERRSVRRGQAQAWAGPRRPARWDHQARSAPPWPVPQAAFPQCLDPERRCLDPERRSEGLAQRRLETRPPDLHCLPRRVAQPKALNGWAGPPAALLHSARVGLQ